MVKKWLTFIIILSLALFLLNRTMERENKGSVEVEIAPYPDKVVELVSLYFGDDSNTFLVKETRVIERTVQLKEELILREIMKGPTEGNLSPTIPPYTTLYSINTINGTAYINFSKEFVTRFRPHIDNEVTAVYSIVNTLTELSHIERVQILVEGQQLSIYRNHLSLKEPFERNSRIINQPFPSAIETMRMYLDAIEKQEYKKVYDLIYNTKDLDTDYLSFYRYMIQNYGEVKRYNTISYRMDQGETGEVRIWVDYDEENILGEIIHHRNQLFTLKNLLGEWRIVVNF